ncbi:uncharacterized protein LOC113290854 [Papaver somniferum]|uniref:uncharacterized protein LOC113290854 n=1 Tax=Papaver somniferum TaxID=3469 RepID=UPI000E6FB799|nr:uncharacterized protein LOC113290854 [Papaver somniferum]
MDSDNSDVPILEEPINDYQEGPSQVYTKSNFAFYLISYLDNPFNYHLLLEFSLSYIDSELVMKILVWNVHGLAQKITKDQLCFLIKTQSPDFLFLSETKINSSRMLSLSRSPKYCNHICIDRVGLAGGLILMWKDGIACEVQEANNNIIHVVATLHPYKPDVLISFMYGSTYFDVKKEQCELMKRIGGNISQPWLVIGDLNVHLHDETNLFNVTMEDKYMQSQINTCGLMDLGLSGREYTWSSNNMGTGERKSRIDLALGNHDWNIHFPRAKLVHLVQYTSNIVLSEDIFNIIPIVLNDEDNNRLTDIPSAEEIHKTVKDMASQSSPGPDGFQAGFYQANWDIVANRMKPFLKHIVSHFQYDFVPSRAIHDNIVMAHEMIHTMKYKEGNSGTMALKPDLSKVFDRYIEQRISTTKISILLNGTPMHEYSPTRGIRQGDPLSRYLFIIVVEYLSRLLLVATNNHLNSGVKAARNASAITHLLFADDILLFTKADMHNISGILKVISDFGKYSGKMLNFNKSSVYFSKNLSPNTKKVLSRALNMSEMQDSDIYLGVTLLLGRDKSKGFKPIIHSFGSRLKNWKGKTMNQSARSTMVKHVLNALPTHHMGSFKLPNNPLSQLYSIQRHFWWGDKNNRGYNPIRWNKFSIPKALGGLGFRNPENFNIALLAKQDWKACSGEDSLCVQILRAKYAKNGSFLHINKLKDDCSWLWRSFYTGLEVIQKYYVWVVRYGTKIKIWIDCWVIGLDSPPVPVTGASIYETYNLDCDAMILNMNIPYSGEDCLIWKLDRNGKFTVKNAYNTICSDYVNTQNTRPRHQGTIARINHLLQQCSKTLARDLNRNVNSLQVQEAYKWERKLQRSMELSILNVKL